MLDLGRSVSEVREAGLDLADLCLLVAAAEIRSVVAGRAVLRTLDGRPVGVVLRRGGMALAEAVPLLGAPVLGVVPPSARPEAPSRAAGRFARGVLDGVAAAS